MANAILRGAVAFRIRPSSEVAMAPRVVMFVVSTLLLTGSPTPALAWENWPGEWSPGRPLLAAAVGEAQLAPVEISVSQVEAPVFRLEVPFRTQKDGSDRKSTRLNSSHRL